MEILSATHTHTHTQANGEAELYSAMCCVHDCMSDDVHVCMPIDTRGRGCDASVNYKCVVRESELLLERVEVVRHHHELWDGLRFLTDLFFFSFFFSSSSFFDAFYIQI